MPHPFVKYVSAVEGHVVSRYGSARAGRNASPIGYRREVMVASEPDALVNLHRDRGAGTLIYQPDVIVALTEGEWARYSREYTRALNNGALRERTEAEYLATLQPTPELVAETEPAEDDDELDAEGSADDGELTEDTP